MIYRYVTLEAGYGTKAISGKEESLSIGSSRADEDIPLGQLWMTF